MTHKLKTLKAFLKSIPSILFTEFVILLALAAGYVSDWWGRWKGR